VVEQDCVYQDLDEKDQQATHLLGYENEKLIAYSRIFSPGTFEKKIFKNRQNRNQKAIQRKRDRAKFSPKKY
jgi:ElaA protein